MCAYLVVVRIHLIPWCVQKEVRTHRDQCTIAGSIYIEGSTSTLIDRMCVLACYWIRIKVYILNKVTIKYNEDTQHEKQTL